MATVVTRHGEMRIYLSLLLRLSCLHRLRVFQVTTVFLPHEDRPPCRFRERRLHYCNQVLGEANWNPKVTDGVRLLLPVATVHQGAAVRRKSAGAQRSDGKTSGDACGSLGEFHWAARSLSWCDSYLLITASVWNPLRRSRTHCITLPNG